MDKISFKSRVNVDYSNLRHMGDECVDGVTKLANVLSHDGKHNFVHIEGTPNQDVVVFDVIKSEKSTIQSFSADMSKYVEYFRQAANVENEQKTVDLFGEAPPKPSWFNALLSFYNGINNLI